MLSTLCLQTMFFSRTGKGSAAVHSKLISCYSISIKSLMKYLGKILIGCDRGFKNFRSITLRLHAQKAPGDSICTSVFRSQPQAQPCLPWYFPTYTSVTAMASYTSHLISLVKLKCPDLMNLLGLSIFSNENQNLPFWTWCISIIHWKF